MFKEELDLMYTEQTNKYFAICEYANEFNIDLTIEEEYDVVTLTIEEDKKTFYQGFTTWLEQNNYLINE